METDSKKEKKEKIKGYLGDRAAELLDEDESEDEDGPITH